MFRRRLLPFAIVLLFATLVAVSGWAQVSAGTTEPASAGRVTLEMLDAEVSPHGDWIIVPAIGRAWRPAARVVGRTFVPYATHGHWTFTQDGWVFDSDLSWGWATFHYGRWVRDVAYGWVWIPGVNWAPAWVRWRSGDGYVGWVAAAPSSFRVVAAHWVFVEERKFLQRDLFKHVVAPRFVAALYQRTLPSTAYVMRSGVRWDTGPAVEVISRAAETEVRPAPRRPTVPERVRRRWVGSDE